MRTVAPKWYMGLVILLFTMVFLVFLAFPAQIFWGMWGLVVTQIGLLIIALLPPLIFKWKLSDMMPVRKFTLKQLLATFLLYIATFIIITTISLITGYFFPGMMEVSTALSDFFTTVPFIFALIAVAVLPGICEEALFRGAILHAFKDQKNKFVVMLIVAALFGLFHLDPYRFLPTAIIGFALTYLMIKTENFLLPVLYHIINNAVSVSAGFFQAGVDMDEALSIGIGLETIGIYLVLSAISPLLYYLIGKLLGSYDTNRKLRNGMIVLSVLLFVIGFILFGVGLSQNMHLYL